MSEALVLQLFREADASGLMNWIRTPDEAVLWGGPEVAWPLTEDYLRSMLTSAAEPFPERYSWSARLGSEIVGHAQAAIDWRTGTARLARIIIAPERRSEGLGAALVRLAMAEISSHPQIHRIELRVYAHNDAALAIYRRLGFRESAGPPDFVNARGKACRRLAMFVDRAHHGTPA